MDLFAKLQAEAQAAGVTPADAGAGQAGQNRTTPRPLRRPASPPAAAAPKSEPPKTESVKVDAP